MIKVMESRYKKWMRKIKAYLLREQRKETNMGRILRYIGMKIFNEHYWVWERRGISIGAGWGAAAAVSPLPFQTIWGILACLWKKGNIPVAVIMAWASPPFFMLFFTPIQWWVGNFIFKLFGSESGASVHMVEQALRHWSWEPFVGVNIYLGIAEYVLGVVASCSIIGFLAYCLVQGLWEVFGREK